MSKGESIASPTFFLEALFTILIIYAYEEIDAAKQHVPGAYFHANFPESKTILLDLWGRFIDILCDINPEYKSNVRYKRGQKVIYLRVLGGHLRMNWVCATVV